MAPRLSAVLALTVAILASAGLGACSGPAPAPAPGSTAAPDSTGPAKASAGTGIEGLSAALDLVKRVYPNATKDHAICLGNQFQRQPQLVADAKPPLDQLDLEARKRLIRALADCIGPDVLWVLYEAKHPIEPSQRDCVFRLLSPQLALADSVNIVAGDPEPAQKFETLRLKQCTATGKTAGTTPGSSPSGG